MTVAILTIVSVYLISSGVWWLLNVTTMGLAKNDKLICEALMKNIRESNYSVNSFDRNIITVGKMPYISTCGLEIIGFQYHINGIGIIPIWYKAHNIIKIIYKDSKKTFNSDEELKKQLNLD